MSIIRKSIHRGVTVVDLEYFNDTQLETELKEALERQEFRLYYQPKLDLVTGKIRGVEALIRWEHPTRGIVSPVDFIPFAENSGLILSIGKWVMRTACWQNKAWQDSGIPPMVMAVNLSARQLYQVDLVDIVRGILEETKLAPEYLELEITESMMLDVEHVLPIVKKLKGLGVQLSLDDFGTGYSSLFYLREFPIDSIKIDQSFVRICTSDTKDASIVKTIIAMAHQLKLGVIAEGVETTDQLVFLQQHLCNSAQGYLFSKPIPAEEFVQKYNELEEIVKRHGVSQYVSTHKMLEEAFEISRRKLRDMVRNQQGMIFKFIESEGKFIHTLCDGELLYKLGLSPQTLIGRELHDFLPSDEAERKLYYYRRAWEGEENVSYEGTLNGICYFASLRPIYRGGQVVEVIASCVDITKRKESEEGFQKVVDFSPTGIVIHRDGQILYANPSALNTIQEEDIVGKSIDCFLHPESNQIVKHRASQAEKGKELPITEIKLIRHDGEVINIKMGTTFINYEGIPAKLTLFSDETERIKAEQAFKKSHKKLKDVNLALDESSVVAISNQNGFIQFVNDKFCEISKYSREELLGQNYRILNSGYHNKDFFKDLSIIIGEGKTWKGEICNRTKYGNLYWVQTTIVPFYNDKGIPYQYVSIQNDITERKRVEEALRLSEERYRLIAENMTDLVCIIDKDGICNYASPSHVTVLGYPAEGYEGVPVIDWVFKDDHEKVQKYLVAMEKGAAIDVLEYRFKDVNNQWIWFEARVTPIFDKEGKFEHFLVVSREIAERRMYQQKLSYMAYHDTLTGLPNRRLLIEKLTQSINDAQRYERKLAVMYLDIDNFKSINDTFGHAIGDELLRQFVQRVKGCIRGGDIFARQGGDEFTILLPKIKEEQDAIKIANRIIDSLKEPLHINQHVIQITSSIGIAYYPKDSNTSYEILKYADNALYCAKKDGRNRYKTYS